MKNKKAVEFSFNMLFAVIVGAVILFLAIYFAVKITSTSRYRQNIELTKELSVLTNPLDTGFAEAKKQIIDLRLETRVYNDCFSDGFGKNIISATSKSGIGKKWVKPERGIELANKYIFSEKMEQGTKLYAFSKKFEMPFYIADLIIANSKDYCFINPPYNIENEILDLGIENIKIENCTKNDIKVCFDKSCEISVYYYDNSNEAGYVDKNDERVFFVGNLVYAAILSDPEIYECNVKRLMNRIVQLTLIYKDKLSLLKDKCPSGIEAELVNLNSAAREFNNSADLVLVYNFAKQLENKNNDAICRIF